MKKIIQNIMFVAFILVSNFCIGQNNTEDVVYLKNGTVIRGMIIEQVPNQGIKIQTKDRSVFVFKYEEIEKMTKESLSSDQDKSKFEATDFKKSGYFNLIELNSAYSQKVGYKGEVSFGFRTSNGYQINEHFAIGIGIGIDKYKNATLLPITIDARMTMLKKKVSPTFTTNIGYAIAINKATNGASNGFVFNPQFGVKTFISKNTAYFFNVGYKLQIQNRIYYDYYNPIMAKTKKKNNYISISTGFIF